MKKIVNESELIKEAVKSFKEQGYEGFISDDYHDWEDDIRLAVQNGHECADKTYYELNNIIYTYDCDLKFKDYSYNFEFVVAEDNEENIIDNYYKIEVKESE